MLFQDIQDLIFGILAGATEYFTWLFTAIPAAINGFFAALGL